MQLLSSVWPSSLKFMTRWLPLRTKAPVDPNCFARQGRYLKRRTKSPVNWRGVRGSDTTLRMDVALVKMTYQRVNFSFSEKPRAAYYILQMDFDFLQANFGRSRGSVKVRLLGTD